MEIILAVQNQAFTISVLILLNSCVGCGISYSIMHLCSGYEQHFVKRTKMTDFGKKTWPTVSLLNKKNALTFGSFGKLRTLKNL